MSDVLWQEEHITFTNDDVVELTLIEDLQDHIALKLVEELFDRVVVVIRALVRTADNKGHHVGIFPDLLVTHRRLQEMPVLLYPVLKVKCSKLRHRRVTLNRPCLAWRQFISDNDR